MNIHFIAALSSYFVFLHPLAIGQGPKPKFFDYFGWNFAEFTQLTSEAMVAFPDQRPLLEFWRKTATSCEYELSTYERYSQLLTKESFRWAILVDSIATTHLAEIVQSQFAGELEDGRMLVLRWFFSDFRGK